MFCGFASKLETPEPKRSLTLASTPQRTGDGIPGGGGTCAAVVLNICPIKPVGVQLAIAIVPPRLQTRNNSDATNSGRGANIAPNIVATMSKLPSAYVSASASPSSN